VLLKRLIAIAVVLGALLLLASSVLWLKSRSREEHSFVLSNGTVVTLRAATFGTNHTFSSIGRWRKFVPKVFARWLNMPPAMTSFTTESPSLVLWFERAGLGGGPQNYTCGLVHADGMETAFQGGRHYASYSPTNSIEGISSTYPQREPVLRIRFYEQKNYNTLLPLGEFTVRNPRISHAPKKPAPPLPQTVHDGDLEVTLVSLESGGNRGRWDNTNIIDQWTTARFNVLEGGRPSTNWTVQRMEATDSTGSKLVSQSWTGMTEKELEKWQCQPVLWPSETYKLRFEFSRKDWAPFDTNELWTIRGVAVPTNGSFNLVNTQMNLRGFKVLFHGVTTPGASQPWNEMMGGSSSLGFSISPEPKDHRFTLVSVMDDKGKVDTTGSGYSNTNWGFGLKLTGESRSIDVTVALHRSRYVDFVAQPMRATNATGKP
jgi:hypothetical protein